MDQLARPRLPHRTALGRLALVLALLPFALLVRGAHAAGAWTDTGDMTTARSFHTATLLPGGEVLVAGGFQGGSDLASSELYNPTTGNWTATGDMTTVRGNHTATLLPSGKVLVAGGANNGGTLASSELYDPATGNWTVTGNMTLTRAGHTATLLPNGKVLVTGGHVYPSPDILASADLYDPGTGTWMATRSMTTAYSGGQTATLLPNGKVLVTVAQGHTSPATAEIYDPGTGTWTATGSLLRSRSSHTATLLPNGKVLVAGGAVYPDILASAELYDPATGTWSATGSMIYPRAAHTATLLSNGKVLVAGAAYRFRPNRTASAELYDPSSGTWAPTGSMTTARAQHSATLLHDGTVLVAGGDNPYSSLATTEVYNPATQAGSAPTIAAQPANQTVTLPASANFTATAASHGGDSLVWQWQRSTNGGASWTNVGERFSDSSGNTYAWYSTPATTAAMNGDQYRVVFTDSAGSVTSNAATLTVGCPGGGKKADFISPTASDPPLTFPWAGGVCVTQYYFYVGSQFGQADLFAAGPLASTVTSQTVKTPIPASVHTIYVRLWSLVNGNWQAVDRTFLLDICNNENKATISSPASGTIHGSSQRFQWTGGGCVGLYYLYVGSSYGHADLFASGPLASSVSSQTVTGLPTNGSTIYLRLWSLVNGNWQASEQSYVTAP